MVQAMTNFLSDRANQREAERQSHLKQEVRELIGNAVATGDPITWPQLDQFVAIHGMNSYEREEVVPYSD